MDWITIWRSEAAATALDPEMARYWELAWTAWRSMSPRGDEPAGPDAPAWTPASDAAPRPRAAAGPSSIDPRHRADLA